MNKAALKSLHYITFSGVKGSNPARNENHASCSPHVKGTVQRYAGGGYDRGRDAGSSGEQQTPGTGRLLALCKTLVSIEQCASTSKLRGTSHNNLSSATHCNQADRHLYIYLKNRCKHKIYGSLFVWVTLSQVCHKHNRHFVGTSNK